MITRSLLKTVEHVWSGDPAIDQASPDYEAKIKGHLEGDVGVSDLPLKPGEPPCVFVLRPLTSDAWLKILRLQKRDQDYEAVACGLQAVRGYVVDGEAVSLECKEGRVAEASLAKIYEPILFQELAARIIAISTLRPFRV